MLICSYRFGARSLLNLLLLWCHAAASKINLCGGCVWLRGAQSFLQAGTNMVAVWFITRKVGKLLLLSCFTVAAFTHTGMCLKLSANMSIVCRTEIVRFMPCVGTRQLQRLNCLSAVPKRDFQVC